jgi:RNA polymerase sigma factor (sigma-70 family)
VPSASPLIQHLPLVERVLVHIRRRYRLSDDEAEDFESWVRLRLVEHGDAVLARFEGKSRLETYLTVVLQRMFLDYRVEKWGKWRPSAAAKRLGSVAVALERLVSREGIPFEEAAEMLRRNHGVQHSVPELAALAGKLSLTRVERRHLHEDAAGEPTAAQRADDAVLSDERGASAARTGKALAEALTRLPPLDQLILKMHYADGHTVAATARALCLEQKPLYARLTQLRNQLRQELERQGITREDVAELIGAPDVELRFDYRDPESTSSRPSAGKGGS